MNTTTSTPTAKSATGIMWRVGPTVFNFNAQRIYGVTDGAGNWLTFDGENPYVLPRKRDVHMVATTMDPADMRWIAEVAR